MAENLYTLPELNYGYKDLEPHISEEQLRIHHQKHHQAYIDGANTIYESLRKAREEGIDLDMKGTLKALSFNVGGHVLHSLFWLNMSPSKKTTTKPQGILLEWLNKEFGSFDRFKKEFTQTALNVEGSGWAVLSFCQGLQKPVLMQIEKHNTNVIPTFKNLLVLDLWEHAYYIDYKNARSKFVDAFWNVVNWDEVSKRLEKVLK